VTESTWVHQIFGGRLRSRVTCMKCGHPSDTFDSILDLSLDVQNCNSLQQALKEFVAVDHLRGEDRYKCEKCQKHVNAEKQFTLDKAPTILTVHLKRFTPFGRKLGHLVKYPEKLSLQPIMSENSSDSRYTLFGVISHAGSGPNSGHYYAHIKSPSGTWYEMNDEYSAAQRACPLDLRSAYILFYMKDASSHLEEAISSGTGKGKGVDLHSRLATAATNGSGPRADSRSLPSGSLANGVQRRLLDSSASHPIPGTIAPSVTTDPQAMLLEKKINSQLLNSRPNGLVQYDSDSAEDIGEKVTNKSDVLTTPRKPSALLPPSSADSLIVTSSPAPQLTPAAPAVDSNVILSSSFYTQSKGMKRQGEVDASSSPKRQRSSPVPTASSSLFSVPTTKGRFGGNPYDQGIKSGNKFGVSKDGGRVGLTDVGRYQSKATGVGKRMKPRGLI